MSWSGAEVGAAACTALRTQSIDVRTAPGLLAVATHVRQALPTGDDQVLAQCFVEALWYGFDRVFAEAMCRRTPRGVERWFVHVNLGPGTPTTNYWAVVDVREGRVFTALDGRLAHPGEVAVDAPMVAGGRYAPLVSGEEVWELFVHGPRAVNFQIGDVCNAACVMCWQALRREQTGKEARWQELRSDVVEAVLARHGAHLNSIELVSFGEPMANPDFERILDAIIAASARPDRCGPFAVNVTTNGSLVHRHLRVADLPGWLTFSIDAVEAALYERIRVGLHWSDVQANVRACVARRGVGRHIGINLVAFEDNIGQIVPTAAFCEAEGLEYLSVLRGVGLERTHAAGREIAPDDPRLIAGIAEARVRFPQLQVNDYATGRTLPAAGTPPLPRRGFCPLPWSQIDIGPDGRVHPCCRSYAIDLGRYDEDVWNGEALRTLRQQILDDDLDPVRFAACACCVNLGAKVRGGG